MELHHCIWEPNAYAYLPSSAPAAYPAPPDSLQKPMWPPQSNSISGGQVTNFSIKLRHQQNHAVARMASWQPRSLLYLGQGSGFGNM